MPALLLDADEPFFREWYLHHGPMTRSRERARMLADIVGLDRSPAIPTVGVVGSKGKGSTVASLTHRLVNMGYRVGTISSPPFLTNRERVRLNGTPLSDEEYSGLAERLSLALEKLPPVEETRGYLAPTGAFTLMGAVHLLEQGIDVLVIEEGLGGASDEISQIRLDTLVVTPVFLEHEGVIGETVEEIAANLVGAGDIRTHRAVIPSSQGPEARAQIERLLPRALVYEIAQPETSWGFGPLTDHNIAVGYACAAIVDAVKGGAAEPVDLGEDDEPSRRALASGLHLPARSTRVRVGETEWFLDAAISADGVRSALVSALAEPEFEEAPLLMCMPDIKDVMSMLELVSKDKTILVTTHEDHLDFNNYPNEWRIRRLEDALDEVRGASHAIALGTMSFAAEMAHALGLDTERWWSA